MYYILLGIALILAYFLITKLVSSLVKGCSMFLGVGLLVAIAYVFILSRSHPVNVFGLFIVEDFSVRKVK